MPLCDNHSLYLSRSCGAVKPTLLSVEVPVLSDENQQRAFNDDDHMLYCGDESLECNVYNPCVPSEHGDFAECACAFALCSRRRGTDFDFNLDNLLKAHISATTLSRMASPEDRRARQNA